MNINTGEILPQSEVEKLSKEAQTEFIPVPEKDLKKVLTMNRAQRRAYARSQRPQRKAEVRAQSAEIAAKKIENL